MKPRERPMTPDPTSRPMKFPDENKWVWDLLDNLRSKLVEGIKPLDDYIVAFNEFRDVLRMDPDEVIRGIENEDPSWEVDRIVEEIATIKAREEDLR